MEGVVRGGWMKRDEVYYTVTSPPQTATNTSDIRRKHQGGYMEGGKQESARLLKLSVCE